MRTLLPSLSVRLVSLLRREPGRAGAVVAALVATLALFATLVAVTAPGAARADQTSPVISDGGARGSEFAAPRQRADGERDYARVPKKCFAPGQEIRTPGPCYLTKYQKSRRTLILWGDSHAWQFIPALRRAVKGKPINLISFASGSCPPAQVLIAPKYAGKCEENDALALQFIKKQRQSKARFKVILASNWGGFRQGYRKVLLDEVVSTSGYTDFVKQMVRLSHDGTPRLFTTLGKLRVDVDVIAQAATVPDRVPACTPGQDPYLCEIPRWRAIPEESETRSWLKGQMRKLANNPRYIDASPSYCDETTCFGLVNGIQTFYDNLHLSATRTRNLAQYFNWSINDLLRKRG
ncbi:SGNH hydrolase domain-containing protein [Nocardioides sp. R-C-SC26]|uniref:SGNH hydrolase domain-containing protein n=1 Tax=Nocardioides sp. R-C-SC26 TaxID=2870414 RepID=UPI001E2CF563|nr:SGNH hydrolase domain-containing protein [Nocardioides sp. R-C-SC26]